MIKNDEGKRIGTDINSNELSSNSPTFPKKIRKDAKGNLILKKKFPIKKTKHHAYLIDLIDKDKKLVNIIDVESYKKYNLDEQVQEEETEKEEEKLEENKIVVSQGCCSIF